MDMESIVKVKCLVKKVTKQKDGRYKHLFLTEFGSLFILTLDHANWPGTYVFLNGMELSAADKIQGFKARFYKKYYKGF